MDIFSRKKRSEIMSKIKGSDTGLERRFKEFFLGNGFKFQASDLPGKPDFAHFGLRIAVFTDGCFWHSCPRHFRMPKSNVRFWVKKISYGMRNERIKRSRLRRLGWSVYRIWEHSGDVIPRRILLRISRLKTSKASRGSRDSSHFLKPSPEKVRTRSSPR